MNADERGGEKNLPENWAQQRVNVSDLPICRFAVWKVRRQAMKTLEEMVQQLPPDMAQEVQDFIEFLLRKRAPQPRGKPEFRWAGALSELHDRYSSVALQHQITEWRQGNSC